MGCSSSSFPCWRFARLVIDEPALASAEAEGVRAAA
jgi:hypothetical protein